MHLIERLEKRARELDREVLQTSFGGHWDERAYNFKAADDRELLLDAARVIRELVNYR